MLNFQFFKKLLICISIIIIYLFANGAKFSVEGEGENYNQLVPEIDLTDISECTDIDMSVSGNTFRFQYYSGPNAKNCNITKQNISNQELKCPSIEELGLDELKTIKLNRGNTLLGYATELEQQSNLYFVSRHVLNKLSSNEVIKKFIKENESLFFYEFSNNSNPTLKNDIVLVQITRNNISKKNAQESVSQKISELNAKLNKENINLYPNWYAHEGGQYKEGSFLFHSCGKVSQRTLGNENNYPKLSSVDSQTLYFDFILDPSQFNFTAPGSSGAIIYQYDPDDKSKKIAPIAMVNCQQTQTQIAANTYSQSNGLSTTKVFTRAINLKRILEFSILMQVSLDEILDPKVEIEKFEGCTPIDGRGVGGVQ